MLEQIEKIFPGFFGRLRRLPWVVRAVLVVAVTVPAALVWVYPHRATVSTWLHREVSFPLYVLVLAALSSGVVVMAIRWLVQHARLLRGIKGFLAEWLAYREELEHLCIKIDFYLVRDREATDHIGELDNMIPFVREYWRRRGRLREHIFRIDERHLASAPASRWQAMKANSIRLREREYLTPFSFLVDLGNPIAEWNLHRDEIWQALHLADEFVEYLRFRYPTLKKISASDTTPNPPLQ